MEEIKRPVRKFNPKSWHIRYSQWQRETSDLPRNLCPHFWRMVWSVPCFIPIFIFCIPYNIMSIRRKSWYNAYDDYCGDQCGKSFLVYAGLSGLYGTLYSYWYLLQWIFGYTAFAEHKGAILTSLVLSVIGIIIFLIWTGVIGSHRPSKPNIVVEGVKAFYHKRCPIMEYTES